MNSALKISTKNLIKSKENSLKNHDWREFWPYHINIITTANNETLFLLLRENLLKIMLEFISIQFKLSSCVYVHIYTREQKLPYCAAVVAWWTEKHLPPLTSTTMAKWIHANFPSMSSCVRWSTSENDL